MDSLYFRPSLFQKFWEAVCAGRIGVAQGCDENGHRIGLAEATDSSGRQLVWPGMTRLSSVLKRTVYVECLDEINNHFTANGNQKLFFTIQGSPGIGKTVFIGFLLNNLPHNNRTARIHCSSSDQDSSHPDIWLWNDGQGAAQIVLSNTRPQDFPNQPFCFISDTYPVMDEDVCSHLHVHMVGMGLASTFQWTEFADCIVEAFHFEKIFTPFTRREHLWCRGQWLSLAEATALHNQARDNAYTAVNREHPASTRPGSYRAADDAEITTRRTTALQKVSAQYARKWAATVAACTAGGGDATQGVWTNWEELQIDYDVFGGCMRTLNMRQPALVTDELVTKCEDILSEFFSDELSASGQMVSMVYAAEMKVCALTLSGLIQQALSDTTGTRAKLRSCFEVHVLDANHRIRIVETSKFMSFFLADAFVTARGELKDMLYMGFEESERWRYVFERTSHSVVIDRLRSGGLHLQRIDCTSTGGFVTLHCNVRRRVLIRKMKDISRLAEGEYGLVISNLGFIDSVLKVGPPTNAVYAFQMRHSSTGTHKRCATDVEVDLHSYTLQLVVPTVAASAAAVPVTATTDVAMTTLAVQPGLHVGLTAAAAAAAPFAGAALPAPPEGATVRLVYVLDSDNHGSSDAYCKLPTERFSTERWE